MPASPVTPVSPVVPIVPVIPVSPVPPMWKTALLFLILLDFCKDLSKYSVSWNFFLRLVHDCCSSWFISRITQTETFYRTPLNSFFSPIFLGKKGSFGNFPGETDIGSADVEILMKNLRLRIQTFALCPLLALTYYICNGYSRCQAYIRCFLQLNRNRFLAIR